MVRWERRALRTQHATVGHTVLGLASNNSSEQRGVCVRTRLLSKRGAERVVVRLRRATGGPKQRTTGGGERATGQGDEWERTKPKHKAGLWEWTLDVDDGQRGKATGRGIE